MLINQNNQEIYWNLDIVLVINKNTRFIRYYNGLKVVNRKA